MEANRRVLGMMMMMMMMTMVARYGLCITTTRDHGNSFTCAKIYHRAKAVSMKTILKVFLGVEEMCRTHGCDPPVMGRNYLSA